MRERDYYVSALCNKTIDMTVIDLRTAVGRQIHNLLYIRALLQLIFELGRARLEPSRPTKPIYQSDEGRLVTAHFGNIGMLVHYRSSGLFSTQDACREQSRDKY
ncbi:hypothetical protein D9M70_472120 [compost metagenome]